MRFFFREASRSLQRNAAPSFAAMASVLVTMLVLGVFIPIIYATTGAANDVRDKVFVNVYLKKSVTKADVQRVRAKLSNDTPHVGSVTFISKEQAYAQERKRNPEAYDLLGSNPLPDTFRVIPDDPDNVQALRNALVPVTASGSSVATDPAIEEVKNRREDTEKILSATNAIKYTVGVLAVLLVLASVLLVANTIRLSLFARRREVEVMKLVGATDWFIRWPFIIEGMIVGAMGGVLAVLFLAVGKVALLDPLADTFALLRSPDTVSFGLVIGVVLTASVAVAALGSGLSLRRFLRV